MIYVIITTFYQAFQLYLFVGNFTTHSHTDFWVKLLPDVLTLPESHVYTHLRPIKLENDSTSKIGARNVSDYDY